MEAVSLLQHQVEQQLQAEGGLSWVQFQLLARLADARGQLTMTQLADGVVYSRSGLTYQAGLLERPASSPGAQARMNAPAWSPSPAAAWPSLAASCPATSRSPAAGCSTPCPATTCTASATS